MNVQSTMLELTFSSISENKPGEKWKNLFETYWPAYKSWIERTPRLHHPNLADSIAALERYMPEFLPTYYRLCELAGNDRTAAQFLTGFQPPAYITGCSQLVLPKNLQLIRNYDYYPLWCEGNLLHTFWNKEVIASGDCLWGVLDGMNNDGLVVSLSFGGKKAVGRGFGIPFILRYVLEFCANVKEAVNVLSRVPSHMAYNIMLLDKTGAHKLVQMAPNSKPRVNSVTIANNHQGEITWLKHAHFSNTLACEKRLTTLMEETQGDQEEVLKDFLKPPLFKYRYAKGFGTLYTAVYSPEKGSMELIWMDKRLEQSFKDFKEQEISVSYPVQKAIPARRLYF